VPAVSSCLVAGSDYSLLERALGREQFVNPRSDLVHDFVGGAAKVCLDIFFSVFTQHCLPEGDLVFFQFHEVF